MKLLRRGLPDHASSKILAVNFFAKIQNSDAEFFPEHHLRCGRRRSSRPVGRCHRNPAAGADRRRHNRLRAGAAGARPRQRVERLRRGAVDRTPAGGFLAWGRAGRILPQVGAKVASGEWNRPHPSCFACHLLPRAGEGRAPNLPSPLAGEGGFCVSKSRMRGSSSIANKAATPWFSARAIEGA